MRMHTDSRHTPWVREWQPVCLVFTQQFCLQYVTDTSDFNSAMWFPFAIFYLRTHGWGHSTLSSVKLISVTSLFQYNFMRGVAITRPFSFWCMRLNGLTFECIRPSVQSYINQYFCDSTTQSHASELEKSPQKSPV